MALNPKERAEVGFWKQLFTSRGRDGFLEVRKNDLGRLAFCPEILKEKGRGLDYGCGLVSILEFTDLDADAYDPLLAEYDKVYRHDGRVRYVLEPSGPYDWILCMNVADHTPDPDALFARLLALLKPGGRLYFEVQFDPSLYEPTHYKLWGMTDVRKHLAPFELDHEAVRLTGPSGQISYEAIYRKPGEKIPRIIYSAWIGGRPLPSYDCYLDTWHVKLLDYEIRLLGDEDVPDSPCTREMLKRGKPVAAAQYACWKKLHETGGIYLDLDVELVKPFDELLGLDAFLGIENDGPGAIFAACGVVGAAPRHPLIGECLEYMDTFDYDRPHVENELGPLMWTKLLAGKGWDRKDADATVAGVRLLDSKRFYPYSWREEFHPSCVTPRTIAVHRWAKTWRPELDETVSIVIPCYNQAEYLAEAIDSALGQTVPPHEVIVVDDGSTMGDPAKVVRRYKGKVKLISRENGGVSAARNTGVAAATGEWIISLDADDRLDLRYIERLIGRGDVVSSALTWFGGDNPGGWKMPLRHPTVSDIVKENRTIQSSLYRRKWWEKVGGYDENMRTGFEDWDFWARVAHAGAKFTCVDEVLFFYRTYNEKDRTPFPSSFAQAQTKRAENLAYMRAKWQKLGISVSPAATSGKSREAQKGLRYPVRIASECHLDGKTYPKGSRIDRETALALKAAGQLVDSRIV